MDQYLAKVFMIYEEFIESIKHEDQILININQQIFSKYLKNLDTFRIQKCFEVEAKIEKLIIQKDDLSPFYKYIQKIKEDIEQFVLTSETQINQIIKCKNTEIINTFQSTKKNIDQVSDSKQII